MTRAQLQRLSDLLADFYETDGLDGADRDEVSHVRFLVNELIEPSDP